MAEPTCQPCLRPSGDGRSVPLMARQLNQCGPPGRTTLTQPDGSLPGPSQLSNSSTDQVRARIPGVSPRLRPNPGEQQAQRSGRAANRLGTGRKPRQCALLGGTAHTTSERSEMWLGQVDSGGRTGSAATDGQELVARYCHLSGNH
jgi:hypothetical protein